MRKESYKIVLVKCDGCKLNQQTIIENKDSKTIKCTNCGGKIKVNLENVIKILKKY